MIFSPHKSNPKAAIYDYAETQSALLRAISNPYRLLILCILKEGEASVSELQKRLDMRQSLVSQHLTRLRAEGLVNARRSEQFMFYSLSDQRVISILNALDCPGLGLCPTNNS